MYKAMEDQHTGVGYLKPLDVDEFMEITLREADGLITAADFRCSDAEALIRCGKTLCALLPGFPVADLFLTDNNAVYYNVDPPLERHELYFATMAVFAAKRAAANWCKKNNVPIPAGADGCSCVTEDI